ncbi:hypothetical protein [Phycicoccus sp. 3266]|uniref:hypothetical protein n=1 Tax=Phycicoccus sp. 3266 TaxID=2817751 RepID=UPI0028675290|nr:hypothetical protein [Phycicoccus sp. 3266]MDR6861957.1 hypothetical protein [Phycicoccus sp. 3266]
MNHDTGEQLRLAMQRARHDDPDCLCRPCAHDRRVACILTPDEDHGDHEEAVILLHPRMAKRMRPLALVHELLHAVAFSAGQLHDRKRTEEQWVLMVTPLLLHTLRSNPKVLAFVLDTQDGDDG